MLARTDGPSVPATTISMAWSRRPVSLPRHPASSMNRTENSGPGSSVRSSASETCTPRMRARWSARSMWRPNSVSDVALRLSIRLALLLLALGHHPRVAAPAALRAVHDQRARLQRDPREATRRDIHVRAGQDEWPQVLVSGAQRSAVEHGLYRQRDDRLGDAGTGGRPEPPPELLALVPGRRRHDEHAVAARPVHGLDDQRVELLEHVAAIGVDSAEIRLDVRQDRVLAEVVANDARHQRVNHLVIP